MATELEACAIVMDVDSDSAISVGSTSSHVSYTNDYKTLPASGPDTHAHIIDLNEYEDVVKEDGMVKLQDAIVTTLYSVSPETLISFLSPTVNTFKAVFGKKDIQLVIWRRGLEVFVSSRALYAYSLLTGSSRLAHTRTIPA
jgi:hypothetical protein